MLTKLGKCPWSIVKSERQASHGTFTQSFLRQSNRMKLINSYFHHNSMRNDQNELQQILIIGYLHDRGLNKNVSRRKHRVIGGLWSEIKQSTLKMSWDDDESWAHSQYLSEEDLVWFTVGFCCIMCKYRHRTFSASKWDTWCGDKHDLLRGRWFWNNQDVPAGSHPK